MNLTNFLVVGAGGAIGAMARYGVHRALTAVHGAEAAWSTLAINVGGSFALGLASGLVADRASPMGLFFMIGVLGAFTTFSTFSMDAVVLLRDRGMSIAALYLILSTSLSIAGFVAGFALTRGSLQ